MLSSSPPVQQFGSCVLHQDTKRSYLYRLVIWGVEPGVLKVRVIPNVRTYMEEKREDTFCVGARILLQISKKYKNLRKADSPTVCIARLLAMLQRKICLPVTGGKFIGILENVNLDPLG